MVIKTVRLRLSRDPLGLGVLSSSLQQASLDLGLRASDFSSESTSLFGGVECVVWSPQENYWCPVKLDSQRPSTVNASPP